MSQKKSPSIDLVGETSGRVRGVSSPTAQSRASSLKTSQQRALRLGSDGASSAQEETEKPPVEAKRMALPLRPFSELPGAAWKTVVASWAAFFAVIVIAFGGWSDLLLVFLVIGFFGAMFFGVPMVLLRINKKTDPVQYKPYIETLNSRLPQSEALAQIVMVPVILTIGLIFIGYIATHSG
jgi:hypothetical protein